MAVHTVFFHVCFLLFRYCFFFQLEQHKDCIYDRVIFTEGGADGPVIETLCGQLEEVHVVTKVSNVMGIR